MYIYLAELKTPILLDINNLTTIESMVLLFVNENLNSSFKAEFFLKEACITLCNVLL